MAVIVLVFSCHVHHCWCWVNKLQSYKHEEKTSTLAIHTNNHFSGLILLDIISAYRHSGTKWGAPKNETTSRICVANPPLLVRFKSSVLLFLGEP